MMHDLLDHSSIEVLLAGLQPALGYCGAFRFLYESGGTTESWKLVEVFTFRANRQRAGWRIASAPDDAVRLRVNFSHGSIARYYLWLDDSGWLVPVQRGLFLSAVAPRPFTGWKKMTGRLRMRVMREPTTVAGDTLQRADQRRDKGLADIFGTA